MTSVQSNASLLDREFPVAVKVRASSLVVRALRWSVPALGGAIVAGILGAATQDIWWPKIKGLMQSWGWLA